MHEGGDNERDDYIGSMSQTPDIPSRKIKTENQKYRNHKQIDPKFKTRSSNFNA